MSNVNSTRHRGFDDDQLATPVQQGFCLNQLYHKKGKKKFLLVYGQGPTVNSSKDHQESEREISSAAWGRGGWLNRAGGDPEGERERN